MIFQGETREYSVDPGAVEDHQPARLGIPDLHLWALAEPDDPPGALLGAIGAALDELYELACEIPRRAVRVEKAFDDAAWPPTHTDDEVELVRRFCDLVRIRPRGAGSFFRVAPPEPDEDGEDIFRGR